MNSINYPSQWKDEGFEMSGTGEVRTPISWISRLQCGSVDVFENCVWDVSGDLIIDEVINYSTADYPCTIRQLYGRYASVLDQGVIRKGYGAPSDTSTTGKDLG